jgi:hypothetical protein
VKFFDGANIAAAPHQRGSGGGTLVLEFVG